MTRQRFCRTCRSGSCRYRWRSGRRDFRPPAARHRSPAARCSWPVSHGSARSAPSTAGCCKRDAEESNFSVTQVLLVHAPYYLLLKHALHLKGQHATLIHVKYEHHGAGFADAIHPQPYCNNRPAACSPVNRRPHPSDSLATGCRSCLHARFTTPASGARAKPHHRIRFLELGQRVLRYVIRSILLA